MKILFSNPCWWEVGQLYGVTTLRQGVRCGSRWPFTQWASYQPGEWKFGAYAPFPFFLAHAAAHTKMLMPDATIEVRDSIARGESYGDFFQYLLSASLDWIVIETATPSLEHDLKLLGQLDGSAAVKLKAKFILCGPLDASHYKEIFDKHPNVHAIVKGEYDKQIAKAIASPRGTVLEHDLLTVDEMNSAAPPIWDTECLDHYWDGCPVGQEAPQLQLWASRGCPFRCCFCVWPAVMTGNDPDGTKARSVRLYSAEWVEKYIRSMLEKVPYRSIYFDDDTFNLNERHVLEICAVMKRIGIKWSAMCRADTLTRTAWHTMKESGCFGVKIGFESGSQYVIDHIVNKRLDLKRAYDTCCFLQSDVGIKVHGTFTIGLPGETREHQAETMGFIAKLYSDGAISTHQLSGTATVEGTPLSLISKGERLAKYDGAIADKDFIVSADGQLKIERMAK